MSMLDWAKEEVRIARESAADGLEGDRGFSYGGCCFESALKAFESLCEDDHRGFSIGLTQGVLNRLIDCKPLTSIEDTDDVWNEVTWSGIDEGVSKEFQCKRMFSLFKKVHKDGTVTYHDVNRIICKDLYNPSRTWYNGFVNRIIDKMYPIAMPYYPGDKQILVICDELLTDEKNGDFDSIGIISIIKPDDSSLGFTENTIGRYFKEGKYGWVEIDSDEWAARKEMDAARKKEVRR